jgi:DNA polymerase III delta prime subunit
MPALQSRCEQGRIHIEKPDLTEFTTRVATVLVTEGVEFDLDTLDSYVKASYPDLRKCLHSVQKKSVTGVLTKPSDTDSADIRDWKISAVDLFKARKYREARQLICAQSATEDINSVFRWMYDNLEIWTTDPEKQDQVIMTIKKGMVSIPMAADQEINLSATLVEIAQIMEN